MGGGRLPAGEVSSDDASSSDESQVTELPSSEQCADCLTAYQRARALVNSRDFIRRYKPGYFIDDPARDDKFEIPETATLLLIGGPGKSALVSKIKSVFDDVWSTSALDMAPVSGDDVVAYSGMLQEHMILKDSTSICVFDTPSWSTFSGENQRILQNWMENGVCHGEKNTWYQDVEFV